MLINTVFVIDEMFSGVLKAVIGSLEPWVAPDMKGPLSFLFSSNSRLDALEGTLRDLRSIFLSIQGQLDFADVINDVVRLTVNTNEN